jgi:hypothetical protein
MIPKIIHQTAATAVLSLEERALRERLSKLLPGWSMHLWTDDGNRQIIADHFPEYLRDYDRITRGVVKADIARVTYMHVYGGFYLDTDYKLLKPFDEALLSQNCLLPIESGEVGTPTFTLGNSVFASRRGHPVWRKFLDVIFQENLPRSTDQVLKDNATALAHGQATSEGVLSVAGPPALTRFYQSRSGDFPDIHLPSIAEFHPNMLPSGRPDARSYGIHLCWGSWRGKKSVKWLTNQMRRKLWRYEWAK